MGQLNTGNLLQMYSKTFPSWFIAFKIILINPSLIYKEGRKIYNVSMIGVFFTFFVPAFKLLF